MTECCREAVSGLDRSECANAGLLLARYLRVPVNSKQADDANVREKDLHAIERKKLFKNVCTASRQMDTLYKQAFARRKKCIETSKTRTLHGVFETEGRMVIGLGGENVLETGLTLEHTYGTPIIPGSALKGLASHYCSQVWGPQNPDFLIHNGKGAAKQAGEFAKILFGDADGAGFITFYDGWITPQSVAQQTSGLMKDVMTPHHGDYYSSKGKSAPTDYDDPNPVLFLTVTGQFHIAVSCSEASDNGSRWAALAFRILKEALSSWGVGGKTLAGYGRMKLVGDTKESGGCCDASEAEKTIEVTMNGFNNKGNPILKTGGNIRCVLPPGEVIEPTMKKGEIRQFRILEIRPKEVYLVTSKKLT